MGYIWLVRVRVEGLVRVRVRVKVGLRVRETYESHRVGFPKVKKGLYFHNSED